MNAKTKHHLVAGLHNYGLFVACLNDMVMAGMPMTMPIVSPRLPSHLIM